MTALSANLVASKERYPNRTALRCDDLQFTYAEFHALRAQSVLTHLTSLIVQGILERYPDMRVVLVGAGTTWIPGYLWRIDADFRLLLRNSSGVESIATGLGWQRVHDPVTVVGAITKDARERVWELAASVAAHLVT